MRVRNFGDIGRRPPSLSVWNANANRPSSLDGATVLLFQASQSATGLAKRQTNGTPAQAPVGISNSRPWLPAP